MSDTFKLIDGLGRAIEISDDDSKHKAVKLDYKDEKKPATFSRKDDLIVAIRVAAMHIYNRADKYVDELTDPENTFISIEFDEHGIPSVSVNKSEHVITPNHVENSLDIKQMWREENVDNR